MNDLDLLREQVSWEILRSHHVAEVDDVDRCIRDGYEAAATLLDRQAGSDAAPGVRAVLQALAGELRRRLP